MSYWLFPASKKRFRLEDFIDDYGFVEFNSKGNRINVGDIAYIYSTAPEKRICYKMIVDKIGIPFGSWFDDRKYSIPATSQWLQPENALMVRLKLVKKLNSPLLQFRFLHENGLSGANWLRKLGEETVNYIENVILDK